MEGQTTLAFSANGGPAKQAVAQATAGGATDWTECEVWLCVNENGEYVASDDADHLHERYGEQVNDGSEGALARRVVKMVVKVPTPAPIILRGTVPAEPSEGELSCQ